MKRLSFLLVLLLASPAFADDASELMSFGMPSALAQKITTLHRDNNVYQTAKNAAGTADINVWKVDATDDTVINADSGDTIKLSVAGTAEATLENDQLTFSGAAFQVVPGATSLTFRNAADDASNLGIADAGAITVRSTIISSGTSTLGWAVVAGANTACTTTCTSACVFGVNTAATEADIVDCADATADECLCAGAS